MPIEKCRTITICFTYSDDIHTWDIEAQVENDAPDSYSCVNLTGCDEVSDKTWDIICAKAEELAWERDQVKPKNKRTGCDCPPYGEGTLAEIIHEDTCPIKLSRDEREAFNDLLRKEKRESHRMSAADLDYEQANSHDSTWCYLNLK